MKSDTTRNARRALLAMSLLGAVSLSACGAQYEVTDLTYGDVYYTDHIDKKALEEFGQVTFVDNRTGATITINNADIRRVSRSAVRHGVLVYVNEDN